MGMQGIRVEMRVIRVGMMGMRRIRVGMMGMWEIRVGMMGIRVVIQRMWGMRVEMRETGGGNEGNKGENLRIEVELTNYNCGEGEK